MNYEKKSGLIINSSLILLGFIIIGALYLGAGGNLDTLGKEKKDIFTEEEVLAGRLVVEEYFRAIAAKDNNAILKTLTPEQIGPNSIFYGDETRTLSSIDYYPDDPVRKSYISTGRGSIKGTKIENVIVFKVSFNVKYPKGNSGAFNEGDYSDWSMILVRKDKDSPWLIDDQGY